MEVRAPEEANTAEGGPPPAIPSGRWVLRVYHRAGAWTPVHPSCPQMEKPPRAPGYRYDLHVELATVTHAPTVSITSPAENAQTSGRWVDVRGRAGYPPPDKPNVGTVGHSWEGITNWEVPNSNRTTSGEHADPDPNNPRKVLVLPRQRAQRRRPERGELRRGREAGQSQRALQRAEAPLELDALGQHGRCCVLEGRSLRLGSVRHVSGRRPAADRPELGLVRVGHGDRELPDPRPRSADRAGERGRRDDRRVVGGLLAAVRRRWAGVVHPALGGRRSDCRGTGVRRPEPAAGGRPAACHDQRAADDCQRTDHPARRAGLPVQPVPCRSSSTTTT